MSELVTLESLIEAAGDDGIELGKRKGEFKSPFELGTAYPIELTEVAITTTKNGYTQAELKVGIVKSDGEVKAAGKVWVTLPVFSEEKQAVEDPEKIKQLRGIFGEKLHDLLRAVDPAMYSVFSRAEKVGKTWHFYDAEGNEISSQAKVQREKLMGKAVIGAAQLLASGKLDLSGKRLFYVRTQDKNKADKFYDNWYSVQPDKFPLAEG